MCSCNVGYEGDGMMCVPACGDGIVVDGEECDDGNGRAGDGCSRTCQVEPDFACRQVSSRSDALLSLLLFPVLMSMLLVFCCLLVMSMLLLLLLELVTPGRHARDAWNGNVCDVERMCRGADGRRSQRLRVSGLSGIMLFQGARAVPAAGRDRREGAPRLSEVSPSLSRSPTLWSLPLLLPLPHLPLSLPPSPLAPSLNAPSLHRSIPPIPMAPHIPALVLAFLRVCDSDGVWTASTAAASQLQRRSLACRAPTCSSAKAPPRLLQVSAMFSGVWIY